MCLLMSNAQPSEDNWIASEHLQSKNLHWAATKIVCYLKTLKEVLVALLIKIKLYKVVFCCGCPGS